MVFHRLVFALFMNKNGKDLPEFLFQTKLDIPQRNRRPHVKNIWQIWAEITEKTYWKAPQICYTQISSTGMTVFSFLLGTRHLCFLVQTSQRWKLSTSVQDQPSPTSLRCRLTPKWQSLLQQQPINSFHMWKPHSKLGSGGQREDKRPWKLPWSGQTIHLKYSEKKNLIYLLISIKNDNNGFSSVICSLTCVFNSHPFFPLF